MCQANQTSHRDSLAGAAADQQDAYSISTAAALLGVSRVTIWRWVHAGRLPVTRLGHRTVRIQRADLEQLVTAQAEAATHVSALRRLGVATGPLDVALGVEAPRPDWRAMGPTDHFVQFYEADAFLLEAVAAYIGDALQRGEAGIVVATEAHRAALDARLQAAGLDVATRRSRGQYVTLDAATTLACFMQDGQPDPERFRHTVGEVVRQAARQRPGVRIFGEMVALLAGAGQHAAALALEGLWNTLQHEQRFTLFCAYPLASLTTRAPSATVEHVCEAHAHVIPAESYTTLATVDERLRAIALWQHQARGAERARPHQPSLDGL